MKIHIENPLDMHLHLREGDLLKDVAPFTSDYFSGAVIMPNLVNPVDTVEKLRSYKKQIDAISPTISFTPYMTLFFRNYSRKELLEIQDEIIGIKLYPAGITTQSENGVTDFDIIKPTLALMEELHIPLLVHGESNGFVMDREKEFMQVYRQLAQEFPQLHIIMEHITTADAIEFLDLFDNVSATLTLHHLLITLDDVIGGAMEPDLFCKPIAKTPRDLEALRGAVLSGHPKIMFGSDSAPHPRHKKECCGCAAGIFSAPVALPMLAEIFEKADKLELFQPFVSDIACKRYNLTPTSKTVTLEQRLWRVPEIYGSLKPFAAGKELRWQVTQ
jgi:dihydroorotase